MEDGALPRYLFDVRYFLNISFLGKRIGLIEQIALQYAYQSWHV